MPLETGTFINDLVITNPAGTDERRFGDDQMRLIKSILKNTFPDASKALRFLRVEPRPSDVALAVGDQAKYLIATSAFAQTLNTAGTLGNGWWVGYRNGSSGIVTLNAIINGVSQFKLYPGEDAFIICDGSTFYALGESSRVLMQLVSGAGSDYTFTGLGANEPRFKIFELEYENLVPAAGSVDLFIQASTTNGVSWNTSPIYQHVRHGGDTAGGNIATGVINDTKVVLATDFVVSGTFGTVRILPSANRLSWEIGYSPGGAALATVRGWSVIPAGVNAVRLIYSAAAITSGEGRMYGSV